MNSRRKSAFETQGCQARINTDSQANSRCRLNEVFQAAMRAKFLRCFPQERTFTRWAEIMTAVLAGTSRKTITSTIFLRDRDQLDWATDFKVFSKSPWEPVNLFRGVVEAMVPFLLAQEGPIVLALDDTALWRTSHNIPDTGWHHDALGPKFFSKKNGGMPPLKWGHQMLHAALLLPPGPSLRPTAITVAFEPILGTWSKKKRKKQEESVPKRKPGRPKKLVPLVEPEEPEPFPDASIAEIKTPPRATELAVTVIRRIRQWLDEFGLTRDLIVVVDSSYCNGKVLGGLPERTELVGRTRKDAKLSETLSVRDGKRVYGEPLPTPESIAQMDEFPTRQGTFVFGCDRYPLRYKEVKPVLWRNGTKGRHMRLFALLPVPHGHGPTRGYKHYGYLLASSLTRDSATLLQAYLMRWEIEVLHRILKSDIGIGQTQCMESSPKVFASIAASYALFSLACRQVGGEARTAQHPRLSKWQENKRRGRALKRLREGRLVPAYRPTVGDNLTMLRQALPLHLQGGVLRWLKDVEKVPSPVSQ